MSTAKAELRAPSAVGSSVLLGDGLVIILTPQILAQSKSCAWNNPVPANRHRKHSAPDDHTRPNHLREKSGRHIAGKAQRSRMASPSRQTEERRQLALYRQSSMSEQS